MSTTTATDVPEERRDSDKFHDEKELHVNETHAPARLAEPGDQVVYPTGPGRVMIIASLCLAVFLVVHLTNSETHIRIH